MDSTTEALSQVVSVLTAIVSGQEELADEIASEIDPSELYSVLIGLLLTSIKTIATARDKEVEDYLRDLGMYAFRTNN